MKKSLLIGLSLRNINLPLLVFLVLFLDVKFIVKIVAIIFILLYDRNWKFGLAVKDSRLPLFYFLIIVLSVIRYFITQNYSLNYFLVFSMGLLQWSLSLLAIHHLKLNVDRDPAEKTQQTIRAFFLVNFLASLFFLSLLIFHPIWLTFWGQGSDINIFHPSAGDAVLGISFDTSTANATINCMGLIYFLYKKDKLFSILCAVVILLCTSNTTYIFTVGVLVLMLLTVRSKSLRIRTFISILAMSVLYLLISPKNREYIRNYFVQLYILNKDTSLAVHQNDSILITDSLGRMIKVPVARVTAETYRVDKSNMKIAFKNLLSISEKPAEKKNPDEVDSIERGVIADSAIYPVISVAEYVSKPGKLISFVQTYFYLKMNFRHLLLGSGIGNFSSKLAFRTSRAGVSGSYPRKYQYISPEFRYNHLKSYQVYAAMNASRHSVLNFPFSVYNQLFGEYGLVGALLFGICYLGYFLKRFRQLSYGRYMIIALLFFFLMEYWFEIFSLVVVFELFLWLNLKEGRQEAAD